MLQRCVALIIVVGIVLCNISFKRGMNNLGFIHGSQICQLRTMILYFKSKNSPVSFDVTCATFTSPSIS